MAAVINHKTFGLEEFLREYRQMDLRPIRGTDLVLEGMFEFCADSPKYGRIGDTFALRLVVPHLFPKQLPIVYELDGRIPQSGCFHVNPLDKSLCLGSPIRLLGTLAPAPTLTTFARNCLIPYLYAVSLKLAHGVAFAFGELPHGSRGELLDYADLFGLKTREQVLAAIGCLGLKKRRANKLTCPCECGRRLGICAFNKRMKKFRQLAERAWFRQLRSKLSQNASPVASEDFSLRIALAAQSVSQR